MDAAVDDQLDIDKLSIEDRLQHKVSTTASVLISRLTVSVSRQNWKARVSGYEALVKVCCWDRSMRMHYGRRHSTPRSTLLRHLACSYGHCELILCFVLGLQDLHK